MRFAYPGYGGCIGVFAGGMSDTDPYERPDAPTPAGKPVRIGPLGWTVIGLLAVAASAWVWPRMLGFMM